MIPGEILRKAVIRTSLYGNARGRQGGWAGTSDASVQTGVGRALRIQTIIGQGGGAAKGAEADGVLRSVTLAVHDNLVHGVEEADGRVRAWEPGDGDDLLKLAAEEWIRTSCLALGRRHSLRERRPRELKPGPGSLGDL
jgi:hypothetical protein